jgi:Holliday junction resolvasome RuvABC DNA-binding subunit
MNKYEYTVTSTPTPRGEEPRRISPDLPDGDNWTLVSSSVTQDRLFWTWSREVLNMEDLSLSLKETCPRVSKTLMAKSLYNLIDHRSSPERVFYENAAFKQIVSVGFSENEATEALQATEKLLIEGEGASETVQCVMDSITRGDYKILGDMKTPSPFEKTSLRERFYQCLYTFLEGTKPQDNNSKIALDKLISMGCSEAETRRAILDLTQCTTQGGCTNAGAATRVAERLSMGAYRAFFVPDPKQETSTTPSTDLTMGCKVPYKPHDACNHTKAVDAISDEDATLQASFGANPTKEAAKELREAVALSDENKELQTFLKTISAKGYSDEEASRALKALVSLIEIGYPSDQTVNAVRALLKKDPYACTQKFFDTTVEEILYNALQSLSVRVLSHCPNASSTLSVVSSPTTQDKPYTIYRTFRSYARGEDNVRVRITFTRNFSNGASEFLVTTEAVGEETGKVYLEDSIRNIPDNTHKVLHETYRIADLLRTWDSSLISLLDSSLITLPTEEHTKLAGEPPT